MFLEKWPLLVVGALTGLVGRWFLYIALMHGGDATYVFPLLEGGEFMVLSIAAFWLFGEKTDLKKTAAIIILSVSLVAIIVSL